MDPKAKIHVPESARKDKVHQHSYSLLRYPRLKMVNEFTLHCSVIDDDGECKAFLTWDEMIRRLNVLEGMKTWEDGIYTGTQIRDFARLICDPTSTGS